MEKNDGEIRHERRGFRVRGRVQGVGFRWWTRSTASELGLGGWVRNEPDGAVVVCAVGPPAALDTLEAALHRGPPAARVDGFEEVPVSGALTYGDFRIEH